MLWYRRWWVIVLAIIFYPLGVLLMWLYAPWHRNIKYGVTGLAAVITVVGMFSGGSTPRPIPSTPAAGVAESPTPRPTPTPIPTATPRPTATAAATPTTEERLESVAKRSLGGKLIKAKLNSVEGLLVANIDYEVPLPWDERDLIKESGESLKELVPAVFGEFTPNLLEVRAFNEFTDVRGNKNLEVAVKWSVTSEQNRGVNWPNVRVSNLGLLVGVYVHPALRTAWLEVQAGR